MCFSFFSSPKRSPTPPSRKPKITTTTTPAMAPTIAKTKKSSSSLDFLYNSTSTTSSHSSSGAFHLHSTSTLAASSPTSLSSLRHSLSDTPHIYPFSLIKPPSPNLTSWQSLLHGKPVFVTHRRLRRPLHPDRLRDSLSLICRSHHSSLIPLLGASLSGNSLYLVHQHVVGAPLSSCLRNPLNPNFTVLSSWLSRVQIASDLADALDYLHNSTGGLGFVHNHVKSGSVIVAEGSLHGRLCHLGTAQLCGEPVEADEKQEKADRRSEVKFEGTRGYMSPEFQVTGFATRKSDVYAFGVVLLELLSGEEPVKITMDEENGVFRRVSLVEAAREVVADERKVRRWVDRRLKDSFPVEVVERMARLAVECVEEDPEKRPYMGRVAGVISKSYLDSKRWAETIGVTTDFSVTLGPR